MKNYYLLFRIIFLFLFIINQNLFSQIINHNEYQVTPLNEDSKLQNEPSVAVTDNAIVIAWNDSYGGVMKSSKAGTCIGWAISYNEGRDFNFGGYLPTNFDGVDSYMKTDDSGNIYISILSAYGNDLPSIKCFKMSKNSMGKWDEITTPVSLFSKNNLSIDRPTLHINKNKIFIAYTEINKSQYLIKYTYTENSGSTWSNPSIISDSTQLPRLCVNFASSGDKLIAFWLQGEKLNEIWAAISKDTGKTFSKSKLLYKYNNYVLTPKGYNIGMGVGPFILYDMPFMYFVKDKVRLICNEPIENGSKLISIDYDYFFNKTTNEIPVSSSPDSVVKMMPAGYFYNNNVFLVYYDRRNTFNNDYDITDVFLSMIMEDGTITEKRLNTVSCNWESVKGDNENAPVQRNFGDYISINGNKNIVVAAWTDGRNGIPQIYCSVIKLK